MKHKRKWGIASVVGMLLALLVLCGPVATWLQSRQDWATPETPYDAVYLVCGACAQDRRITALTNWLESKWKIEAISSPMSAFSFQLSPFTPPLLLIGNDPQKSLWCRKHQTNHTKTEWAVEKLRSKLEIGNRKSEIETGSESVPENLSISNFKFQIFDLPIVVPGTFANTDGEMVALATYLHAHPKIHSISLVTSRFHARRCLQRFRTHVGPQVTVGIIPGVKYWKSRAPWIVLGELLKMLRDRLHLSQVLTRPIDA